MSASRALLAAGLCVALAGCGSLATYVPSVEFVDAAPGRMDVVDGVVDGDTVDIAAGTVRVRILGIDAPESVHPSVPVECGGPESAEWARSVLPEGAEVRVEFEPGREETDRYGRLLAYVMYRDPGSLEWRDFSVESARAGMSHNYVYDNRPVSRQDQIAAAEAEARNAGAGFWGSCPR